MEKAKARLYQEDNLEMKRQRTTQTIKGREGQRWVRHPQKSQEDAWKAGLEREREGSAIT